MDDEILLQLTDLGLSSKEAACYLVCLEFGPVLASSIAKQTGIKRSSIYDILDNLLKGGYLSIEIKGGVKYFLVEDPSKIQLGLQSRLEKADLLVPKLKALKTAHIGKKPVTRNLYSEAGVVSIFEDLMKSKEIWSYGHLEPFLKVFGRKRMDMLLEAVGNEQLQWFDLQSRAGDERKYVVDWCKEREVKTYFYRVLGDDFRFPNGCMIYNDHTVVFFSYDRDLSLVVVEDEDIFKSQKEVFKVMWTASK